MLSLSTPATSVSPLAKKYETSLERLGIESVRDLLWHLPLRYEDYSNIQKIDDAEIGKEIVIVATVVSVAARRGWRSKKNITEAILEDSSGRIKAVWFNQRYLTKVLTQGSVFYFTGKVIDFYGLTLSNPKHERYDVDAEALHFGKLTPVYPSSGKLTQKLIRFFTMSALKREPNIVEHLDSRYINEHHMLNLADAVKEIHFPSSEALLDKAIYRLKFEELWQVQSKGRELRKELEKLPAYALEAAPNKITDFLESLPFTLTKGQQEVLHEVRSDIKKTFPMIRLIQGEVGSGKTVVAAVAAYQASLSGRQAALMAPTEVLASQHFKTFSSLFKSFDCTIGLLTGSNKVIARHGVARESNNHSLKQGIKSGTVDIVIGTHALIQKHVTFNALALAIVDEQQRFGVKQRQAILTKDKQGVVPHMLSLTATPIPRTYIHYLYGALDVSSIEMLPQGRKKVITKLVKKSEVEPVYTFIDEEIAAGRQVFVICPVITESDTLGVEAVSTEEEKLNKVFPKVRIAVLHGRQSGATKEKTMRAFSEGSIDILISTAVVEVGIDVPNASVMLIESPERFGLAQLHQFRGRVGRGEHESHCFIVVEDELAMDNKRLTYFTKIDNGFELSEKDLEFRGPGEIYGIKQSGFLDFKIATLKDVVIMKAVKSYLDEFTGATRNM